MFALILLQSLIVILSQQENVLLGYANTFIKSAQSIHKLLFVERLTYLFKLYKEWAQNFEQICVQHRDIDHHRWNLAVFVWVKPRENLLKCGLLLFLYDLVGWVISENCVGFLYCFKLIFNLFSSSFVLLFLGCLEKHLSSSFRRLLRWSRFVAWSSTNLRFE
jgi:hypothetical protein